MRCRKDEFEILYVELLRYKEENGHVVVPARHVTGSGYKLGDKIHHIRTGNRKLTENEIKRLNDIGFVWQIRSVKSENED